MSGATSHHQLQCQSQKLSAGLSVSDQVTGRPTLVLGVWGSKHSPLSKEELSRECAIHEGPNSRPGPTHLFVPECSQGIPNSPRDPHNIKRTV